MLRTAEQQQQVRCACSNSTGIAGGTSSSSHPSQYQEKGNTVCAGAAAQNVSQQRGLHSPKTRKATAKQAHLRMMAPVLSTRVLCSGSKAAAAGCTAPASGRVGGKTATTECWQGASISLWRQQPAEMPNQTAGYCKHKISKRRLTAEVNIGCGCQQNASTLHIADLRKTAKRQKIVTFLIGKWSKT